MSSNAVLLIVERRLGLVGNNDRFDNLVLYLFECHPIQRVRLNLNLSPQLSLFGFGVSYKLIKASLIAAFTPSPVCHLSDLPHSDWPFVAALLSNGKPPLREPTRNVDAPDWSICFESFPV